MSGNKLLDTNILIYLSRKDLSLDDIITPSEKVFISVITYMEALGYPFKKTEEEEIISQICKTATVIHLTPEIIQNVISLRKKKRIKLPDAIIFSSAKSHNLDLITANETDFKGLNGNVKVINPLEK